MKTVLVNCKWKDEKMTEIYIYIYITHLCQYLPSLREALQIQRTYVGQTQIFIHLNINNTLYLIQSLKHEHFLFG